jgi:hypothetical protein
MYSQWNVIQLQKDEILSSWKTLSEKGKTHRDIT